MPGNRQQPNPTRSADPRATSPIKPRSATNATGAITNYDDADSERIQNYAQDARALKRHPGKPMAAMPSRLPSTVRAAWTVFLSAVKWWFIRGALVVVSEGCVAERVCGQVVIIDFNELGEPCHSTSDVLELADLVWVRFGKRAKVTIDSLHELAAHKRAQAAQAAA